MSLTSSADGVTVGGAPGDPVTIMFSADRVTAVASSGETFGFPLDRYPTVSFSVGPDFQSNAVQRRLGWLSALAPRYSPDGRNFSGDYLTIWVIDVALQGGPLTLGRVGACTRTKGWWEAASAFLEVFVRRRATWVLMDEGVDVAGAINASAGRFRGLSRWRARRAARSLIASAGSPSR